MGSELIHGDFTGHHFAPHDHDTWTIGWVVAGANNFRRERQCYSASAGSVCVVNPAEVHTGGGERMTYRCLMPSPELLCLAFPEVAPDALCTTRAVFDHPVAVSAARRLFTMQPTTGDMLTPQGAAVALLRALLWRGSSDHDHARTCGRAALAPAMAYLQDHLERQVLLSELSEVSGMSAFQICRGFAAHLHMSPGAFVRSRRVARAQQLIRDGSDLGGAAAGSGFADQAHMTRLFRSVLGCTPAQWRGAI